MSLLLEKAKVMVSLVSQNSDTDFPANHVRTFQVLTKADRSDTLLWLITIIYSELDIMAIADRIFPFLLGCHFTVFIVMSTIL